MRVMYVFRGGDDVPTGPGQEERMAKWGAWIDSMGEAFLDGAPFGEGGKVLRSSDGTAEEGSFGSGEQEVSGFVTVTVDGMDQAVELARGCPIYDVNGVVEIREAIEM